MDLAIAVNIKIFQPYSRQGFTGYCLYWRTFLRW